MACLLLLYLFTKCVITSVKTCSPASAQCHVAIHTTCASELLQIMGSPLVPKPPANIFFNKNESFISDQAECYIVELNLSLFRKKKCKDLSKQENIWGEKKRSRFGSQNAKTHCFNFPLLCFIFSSYLADSEVNWIKSTGKNKRTYKMKNISVLLQM